MKLVSLPENNHPEVLDFNLEKDVEIALGNINNDNILKTKFLFLYHSLKVFKRIVIEIVTKFLACIVRPSSLTSNLS